MRYNRRKYDGGSFADLLAKHADEDEVRFEKISTKLARVEKAVYGLYVALAFFAFLLDHPKIITSLTTPAQAEDRK